MELTLGGWRPTLQPTPPPRARVAQMYDAGALRWHDSIRRLGFVHAYQHLWGDIQRDGWLRRIPNGGQVLDGGIGTGALSLALANAWPQPLQLVGVDLSAQMLAQAGRVLAAAGVCATLYQQAVEQLPFAEQSFDLVMSAHMLEYVASPAQAIAALVRLLKPGAPLVMVVSKPHWLTALLQLRWRYRAFPPATLCALLGAAGVQAVRCYPLHHGAPRRMSMAYVGFKAATPSDNGSMPKC
jgi:demethylmenaquinone methyltransferase/2-methoxy-6-polyprenyl-1,4-benzoquinol methylase